jgi:hypothetical protein
MEREYVLILFSFDSSYEIDYIKQRIFEELDTRPDRQVILAVNGLAEIEHYKVMNESKLKLQVDSTELSAPVPSSSKECIIL